VSAHDYAAAVMRRHHYDRQAHHGPLCDHAYCLPTRRELRLPSWGLIDTGRLRSSAIRELRTDRHSRGRDG
jgi:hypothetical protein